jgi:toxin ParE1/3/4
VSYFFHPEARAELLEQVAFYESRRRGLGARFLAAFETTMEQVCAAPRRHRIECPPDLRRCRIAGFPYDILFRQSGEDEVEVLAVSAHRRRPGYWHHRL